MLQNWHENEAGINTRFTNGGRKTAYWGFSRQTDSPGPLIIPPGHFCHIKSPIAPRFGWRGAILSLIRLCWLAYCRVRRGGRVVEGARLLSEYTVKSCIEGSNPFLSASLQATYSR